MPRARRSATVHRRRSSSSAQASAAVAMSVTAASPLDAALCSRGELQQGFEHPDLAQLGSGDRGEQGADPGTSSLGVAGPPPRSSSGTSRPGCARPGRPGSGGRRRAWRAGSARSRRRAGCAARRHASESNPRSRNARSAPTASAVGVPEHGRGPGRAPGPARLRRAARRQAASASARSASPVVPPLPAAAAPCGGQLAEQRAGPDGGEGADEPVPVDVGDDLGRLARPGRPGAAPATARSGSSGADSDAPGHVGRGRWSPAMPPPPHSAPGDRGRRQARGPALFGERVQHGVGRGVVGLAGVADRRRRPRRTGRTRTGPGPGSARAGPGAEATLARNTASNRSGVRPSRTPSSRTPAAWTTAVSGAPPGIAASTLGERVAVGDVAGGDRDLGAQRGEFGPQFLRAGGVRRRGG